MCVFSKGSDASVERDNTDKSGRTLTIRNLSAAQVGEIVADSGLPLHHLAQVQTTLEQAFMDLTAGALEYEGTENDPTLASVAATARTGGRGDHTEDPIQIENACPRLLIACWAKLSRS